jgi:hypothetical protein
VTDRKIGLFLQLVQNIWPNFDYPLISNLASGLIYFWELITNFL